MSKGTNQAMNQHDQSISSGERGFRWLLWIGMALMVAYMGREKIAQWAGLDRLNDPNAVPRAVTPRGNLAADEETTIQIFDVTSPSVVFVTTGVQAYRRTMLGIEPERVAQGTGSGFVWDTDGHLVTNFHVIASIVNKPGATCLIRLKNTNEEYVAKLVGADPGHDIAVLKISAPSTDLKPIPVGESKNLLVGQKVFAIGNPYGFDRTLTTGVISALERSIGTDWGSRITGLIQTDAAISPGSSGGPLLDSAGRLIGMTTAVSNQPLAANIGFALPVDVINEIVTQLIKTGRTSRPALGIGTIDPRAQRQFGIPKGLLVATVLSGSAAEKAGIKPARRTTDGNVEGDILLAIDGREVNTIEDLRDSLSNRKVGEVVTLTVLRGNESLELKATLQEME